MATDKNTSRDIGSTEKVKSQAESAETTREQGSGVQGEGFVLRDSPTTQVPKGKATHLPPVDFSGFILGLGQMVLIHLGDIPEPLSGTMQVDLAQASHTIDLLDMLAEKTRGNLTPEESQLLGNLCKELKLKYVQAR